MSKRLIYEEDAIEWVENILEIDKYYHPHAKSRNVPINEVIDRLKRVPTAQPQRMKGRWIHDGYDIPHGVDWMHCSVCGRREPYVPAAMTNFCPSCGAKMEVEHDTHRMDCQR